MRDKIWLSKLLAFTHDPAEKALILLRGAGHEEGTVRLLREKLKELGAGVDDPALEEIVRRADRWAAAADRPQLPRKMKTQVNFASQPALIHPLTGGVVEIKSLADDVNPKVIERLSFKHFEDLIVKADGGVDLQRTFLAFWRAGPMLGADELELLWRLLPADTRSPDHSIWEHLRLASAFAGAMTADESNDPALLLVSLGPVQDFISQARKVSDLWAGSHLLSRLCWEAMRPLCEEFGPDCVIFPDLHGMPLVDLWLEERYGIDVERITGKKPLWKKQASDANPLFAATLPNRFVAVVPASMAEKAAREVVEAARRWMDDTAKRMLDDLVGMAGVEGVGHAAEQARRQLEAFPQINWAVAPWSLCKDEKDDRLVEALKALGMEKDYLHPDFRAVLGKKLELRGEDGETATFYTPNPGVYYPGMYEAIERLHAAAKSVRPFAGHLEKGYRCSVCGEREWLTTDEKALERAADSRGETVWKKAGDELSGLVKENECLCAWCALKRLWPRLFVKELEEKGILDDRDKGIRRFVVSTHTMAIASTVERWLDKHPEPDEKAKEARCKLDKARGERAAWPQKVYEKIDRRLDGEDRRFVLSLPLCLENLQEQERESEAEEEAKTSTLVKEYLGEKPEAYYALVLMDGDRMGAWLSGDASDGKLGDRFREEIKAELEEKGLSDYLRALRPLSPAWHQAISSALNNFSLRVARYVVEKLFSGKLIYAGGDDLLAMVTVGDLPALMMALRCAYSGVFPNEGGEEETWRWLLGTKAPPGLRLRNGYAYLMTGGRKWLVPMMGSKAGASIGAVVAHYKAPLGRVLRLLRDAERRAKNAGRDAFCLTLSKRAGGTTSLVGKWMIVNEQLRCPIEENHMGLLLRLRDVLAARGVSRRATYLLWEQLRALPDDKDALRSCMAFQLKRQAAGASGNTRKEIDLLSSSLADAALSLPQEIEKKTTPQQWLQGLMNTAEFLAREGRAYREEEKESKKVEVAHG